MKQSEPIKVQNGTVMFKSLPNNSKLADRYAPADFLFAVGKPISPSRANFQIRTLPAHAIACKMTYRLLQ